MSVRMMMQGRPPAGGGGPLVIDSFDRTDATSLGSTDGGSLGALAWAATTGSLTDIGIEANRAVCRSAGDRVQTVDCGESDVSVVGTVNRNNVATNTYNIGLVARCVDTSNFLVALAAEDGNVSLYRKSSGTYTSLGSWAHGGLTVGVDYQMELRCIGTSVKVFFGGSEVISVTETAHQTATRVGMRLTIASNSRLTDFEVSAA